MRLGEFEFYVVVDGAPLPERTRGLPPRAFRRGQEFSLQVKVPDWGRHMVIISVDGLNVLSGKTATSWDDGFVVSGKNTPLEVNSMRFDGAQSTQLAFGKAYGSLADAGVNQTAEGAIIASLYMQRAPFNLYQVQPCDDGSNVLIARSCSQKFMREAYDRDNEPHRRFTFKYSILPG